MKEEGGETEVGHCYHCGISFVEFKKQLPQLPNLPCFQNFLYLFSQTFFKEGNNSNYSNYYNNNFDPEEVKGLKKNRFNLIEFILRKKIFLSRKKVFLLRKNLFLVDVFPIFYFKNY